MNQNKNWDKRCSEICQKIFRAIRRIVWGGQAADSAQSEADPSVDIQSKPEGGRRITLVLENGEGNSPISRFPDNRVAIVAARTKPVKTTGHPGPGQSVKIVAVTKPPEKTGPGSNTGGSGGEVTITHGERAGKPKSESTLSVDQESKRSGHDMERRFSDFINRTWLKIRSMSNVGEGKDHSPPKNAGHDHHDHFADHSTRAKKTPRTTSNMGGGGGGGFSSK